MSATDRYRIDFEKLEKWIQAGGFKTILIQSPPGLRGAAVELAEKLSHLTETILLHGGSCWGGCDIAFRDAETLKADAIIHLGHARFLEKTPIPTYYLECRYKIPLRLLDALERLESPLAGFKRVGLGLVVQWLDFLGHIRKKLKEMGFDVFVGEPVFPLRYEGQVLGCGYFPLLKISDKVDCFLVIGSKFHGLGLALQTNKRTYAIDPEAGKIFDLEGDVKKLLRSRYAYIERFKRTRRVGVIVSVKPGQLRLKLASKLRKILKRHNKQVEIFVMDDVSESHLKDLPVEGFVNTACPRLSVEDQLEIDKPLLLPAETLIALGELRWRETIRTPKYLLMEVP